MASFLDISKAAIPTVLHIQTCSPRCLCTFAGSLILCVSDLSKSTDRLLNIAHVARIWQPSALVHVDDFATGTLTRLEL